MRTDSPDPAIAIIGGGASGTLVAAQLLRHARDPVRVLLIERMSDIGSGVAYGTGCHAHLLNVPVERMGAWPDEPGDFLAWIAARAGLPGYPVHVAAGDFVPRVIYGEYLRDVLDQAVKAAAPGTRFERIKGEALDIEEEESGVRIRLGDGRSFPAGQVVLAIGNLPGEYPIRRALPVYHSQRYVHVPWRRGAFAGLAPDSPVLIVGAGLTAIDVMIELKQSGHRGPIHAVSRRGLQPQVHRSVMPYPCFLDAKKPPRTIRELLRRTRLEVTRAAALGIDWRSVIDALRPVSQAIWRGLAWEERARFMRHVRPFWEVHRHRLAPPIAGTIERMRAGGQLTFYAGRLTKMKEVSEGVEVEFRVRGARRPVALTVDRVINCTGPRTDYSKYQHPLLVNLLARGLIDHDPLALGIEADADGRVRRYRAELSGWLYTIGAPLKGVLWECTAMPEIRSQAARLAERLIAGVGAASEGVRR